MPHNPREPRFPLTLHVLATVLLTLVFCVGGAYWVFQNLEDSGLRMLTSGPICLAAFYSSSALTGLSHRLKNLNRAGVTALANQKDADADPPQSSP